MPAYPDPAVLYPEVVVRRRSAAWLLRWLLGSVPTRPGRLPHCQGELQTSLAWRAVTCGRTVHFPVSPRHFSENTRPGMDLARPMGRPQSAFDGLGTPWTWSSSSMRGSSSTPLRPIISRALSTRLAASADVRRVQVGVDIRSRSSGVGRRRWCQRLMSGRCCRPPTRRRA